MLFLQVMLQYIFAIINELLYLVDLDTNTPIDQDLLLDVLREAFQELNQAVIDCCGATLEDIEPGVVEGETS